MKSIRQNFFKLIVGASLAFVMGLTYGGVGSHGSGRAYGEITAFASIFVNGVEYDISTATITINGAPATQADLKLGMAVLVDGTINAGGLTGVATTVDFLGDIEGTLDAAPVISGTNGVFKIYGLVIKTDSKTKYTDGVTLASLIAGDTVEVSGLFNANDGSFAATRIEKRVSFLKAELRGFVSNLNTTAKTFVLGPSLIVNYSTAQVRDPINDPFNGLFVEVKAISQPVNNVLAATAVSGESSVLASPNMQLGVVQGVAAAVAGTTASNSFSMGNQPIVTNAQTVFDGAPVSALVNGAKAIAAGTVLNGVMTAQAVTIAPPPAAVVTVQSRKTHGAVVPPFDLPIATGIPIGGAVTVEPRAIGSGHTILFTFDAPVTSVGGVTSKDASGLVDVGAATLTFVGSNVTVSLTGVTDNQRANITLTNVNEAGNNASVAIGFLVGDVNSSRAVNASDIMGVKARAGQVLDNSNFRFDVNASGAIDVADSSAVKARAGLMLP